MSTSLDGVAGPNFLDEFPQLLDRARCGDQDALRLLVLHFSPALEQAISRHMRPRKVLRSLVGDSDLLQETWMTTFDGRLHDLTFPTPDDFLRFLSAIAENKIRHAHRDQCVTQKRSRSREQPITSSQEGHAVRPDQEAEANDLWSSLLNAHPPEHQRALTMHREGYTRQEIAQALAISDRTVTRILQSARAFLDRGGGSRLASLLTLSQAVASHRGGEVDKVTGPGY